MTEIGTGSPETSRWKSVGLAPSLMTSAFVGLVTLAANLAAPFGPVDDHEPLRWLGSNGQLSVAEVLPLLATDTELGDFGEGSRFRPAYYGLRMMQTVLFGANPMAWYLSVILGFIATNTILGFSISRWWVLALEATQVQQWVRLTGAAVGGGVGALLVATIFAWSGIVTRLGPSELLATFGAATAVMSGTYLLTRGSGVWWWPLLFGVVIAVWSKEVMLPWALLPAVIAFARWHVDSRRLLVATSVLGVIPAAVVVAALLPPIVLGSSSGYGSPTEGSRLGLMLDGLFVVLPTYWAPSLFVISLATLGFAAHQWGRNRRVAVVGLLALGLSAIWFFFDGFIYAGTYDLVRYGMNWQLLKILWILASLPLAWVTLRNSSRLSLRAVSATALALSIVLALLALAQVPDRLNAIRQAAELNRDYAQRYQNQMGEFVSLLQSNPDSAAVLVLATPVNTEGLHAIAQQLRFSVGDDRSFYVTFDPRHPDFAELTSLYPGNGEMSGPSGLPLAPNLGSSPRICAFILTDPGGVDLCDSWPSLRIDA